MWMASTPRTASAGFQQTLAVLRNATGHPVQVWSISIVMDSTTAATTPAVQFKAWRAPIASVSGGATGTPVPVEAATGDSPTGLSFLVNTASDGGALLGLQPTLPNEVVGAVASLHSFGSRLLTGAGQSLTDVFRATEGLDAPFVLQPDEALIVSVDGTNPSGNHFIANIVYDLEASPPELLSPADDAESASNTFTWKFNPTDARATQEAFAFRRVTDAGEEWWNGTGWQSTEIFITSSDEQLVLPPGAWA
jgi:hypothetical protein